MAQHKLRVGYLVGSNHTGSTLLALFMDTHPRIASVGETSPNRGYPPGGAHCSCGAWVRECPFWHEIFEGVRREGFDLSPYNWSNDYRYRNGVLHPLLSRFSHYPPIRALQRLAAERLPGHRSRVRCTNETNVAFIKTVLDLRGAEVLFDTSKYAMRLYHFLRMKQLDVRVIRLVRDVRGFVCSEKRRGHSAERGARVWRRHQEVFADLTRGLSQERLFLLRYEDVCENPRHWFRQLHSFLGVDFVEPPPTVFPAEHHILGNPIRKQGSVAFRAPDRWEDRLTNRELAQVLDIAGEGNRRLGYA